MDQFAFCAELDHACQKHQTHTASQAVDRADCSCRKVHGHSIGEDLEDVIVQRSLVS